ncbi:MAG: hypothetical protein ABJE10_21700 [bacterium]
MESGRNRRPRAEINTDDITDVVCNYTSTSRGDVPFGERRAEYLFAVQRLYAAFRKWQDFE